jgi:hypothetical protein
LKKNIFYCTKLLCLGFLLFCFQKADAQKTKSDSISKPIASIYKPNKLVEGQKRMSSAFKPIDSSRIVKKNPTIVNKNAAKSAQDPDALTFGNFKVSKQLYGDYGICKKLP